MSDYSKIYSNLSRLTAGNFLSFATPAHRLGKGLNAVGLSAWQEIAKCDISPPNECRRWQNGDFRAAEQELADLYGARRSFFLYNGSTVGLLALQMLFNEQDAVVLPRNCHRSLINGLILSGARPVFVYPSTVDSFAIPCNIATSDWQKAVQQVDVKAIFALSPTYNGIVNDWQPLSMLAQQHDLILLCDEAHGPHLKFSCLQTTTAGVNGVSACVQSAHKLLPVLSQASWLHCYDDKVDSELVKNNLQILQSSSPNYMLITSLDAARAYLQTNGRELTIKMKDNALLLRKKLSNIKCIKVLDEIHLECDAKLDFAKITINVTASGLTGCQVEEILLTRYNIQVEMSDVSNILIIISGWESTIEIDKLATALYQVVGDDKKVDSGWLDCKKMSANVNCIQVLTPREAWRSKKRIVNWRQSVDCVAASTLSIYPPGTALIIPGEKISIDILYLIDRAKVHGLQISGWIDGEQELIEVVK